MITHTEAVCDRNSDSILDKANVVGVAGGDNELIVFVTEKLPLDQLDPLDVVDGQVEDVPTDVIQVGTLTPMLSPGDSIGLASQGTGTYGGPVVDELGNQYLLTNNHVAANSNRALALSAIHHPGQADGLGGRIGVLARFEPIYFDRPNYIDAALVRSDGPLTGMAKPSTTTGRVGWAVQKLGRTTGHTTDKIIGRNATVDINFGSQGVARFRNQIVTGNILSPGDSGSVLLSRSGHPVGLGFAGSDTISLHNPINLVLRTLGVRFI